MKTTYNHYKAVPSNINFNQENALDYIINNISKESVEIEDNEINFSTINLVDEYCLENFGYLIKLK
jgi:hypothetical protein